MCACIKFSAISWFENAPWASLSFLSGSDESSHAQITHGVEIGGVKCCGRALVSFPIFIKPLCVRSQDKSLALDGTEATAAQITKSFFTISAPITSNMRRRLIDLRVQ